VPRGEQFQFTFMHASPEVQAAVREWFETRALPCQLDGDRSIRIAHPDYEGMELKIKGAGFRGGPIGFGQLHQSKLKAPVFDFDGRMMEDVASGHDNALLGGASFQQTAAEYRMSVFLQRIRIPHVLCTAYGKLDTGSETSWFSLHDWDPRLIRVSPRWVTPEEFASAMSRKGKLLLDLALNYNMIGNCAYAKLGDEYYLLDLHFFRHIDAFNSSQISWVMQVIFNLHIVSLAVMHFSRGHAKFPSGIRAYPFRCVLPSATDEDHEDLRSTIVAPYMLNPPKDFSTRALCAALARNRIGAALLEICPREFTRP
jgi:hypothetical protein